MTKTFFFFAFFFFEECSLFSFNNLGLTLGITLKFYTSVTNGLKLKVRIFLGLIPTFVEVNLEKLVRDLSAPILNMVKLYVTQIAYKKIGLFLLNIADNVFFCTLHDTEASDSPKTLKNWKTFLCSILFSILCIQRKVHTLTCLYDTFC